MGWKTWVSVLLDQLTCHTTRNTPHTQGEGLHLRGVNSGWSFGTAGSIPMSRTNRCRRPDLLGGSFTTQQPIPHCYFPPGQHRSSSQAKWAAGRSTHSLTRSSLSWSAEEEAPSWSLLPEEGRAEALGCHSSCQALGEFAVYRLYVPHHTIKVRKPMKPLDQAVILIGDYNCPDIC